MNRKNILIGIVVVAVLIIGYFVYKDSEESLYQNDSTKSYVNSRVGYTVKTPDGWESSLDESYQKDVDLLIADSLLIPDSRGVAVSQYVFASNSELLECKNTGLGFNNCLKDVPTGAYTEVSVSYRDEKSIQEVVSNDSEVFGTENFVPASVNISGRETFRWDTGQCPTCVHQVTYIFNGKDNYTYQVDQLIHVNPNETVLSDEEAYEKYVSDLEILLDSLTIDLTSLN